MMVEQRSSFHLHTVSIPCGEAFIMLTLKDEPTLNFRAIL